MIIWSLFNNTGVGPSYLLAGSIPKNWSASASPEILLPELSSSMHSISRNFFVLSFLFLFSKRKSGGRPRASRLLLGFTIRKKVGSSAMRANVLSR